MLAIPELISGRGSAPDKTIWHKPIGRAVEEFQAIACSEEEGVTMPWAKVEVPLRLSEEHEQWCPDCLAIIRTKQ